MADPVTPSHIAPAVDASLSVGPEPLHTNGANGRHKPGDEGRDPYLGVLLLLLVVCVVGVVLGLNVGRLTYTKTLLDGAIALGVLGGLLVGVLAARAARAKPATLVLHPVPTPEPPVDAPSPGRMAVLFTRLRGGVRELPARAAGWIREPLALRVLRIVVALAGIAAIVADVRYPTFARVINPVNAGIFAGTCLLIAALAAMASRYMADIEPARLPEAPGLARAARTTAWVMALAALSIGVKYAAQGPRFTWASPLTLLNAIHYLLLAIDTAICVNLLFARAPLRAAPRFPTELFVFEALGGRTNPVASVLDTAERRLGIDLRSTWAVSVVRQSVEPLIVSLIVFGWISTSVTVVGVQEEALIERLGVPVQGEPLGSGLHFHLPWPIDRVYRIPTLRVQAITIGNETEPRTGPENVLWSVSHVANEFTLLLGDGRDLITIDGTLQFRIVDARAWRYNSQNPADALRVLAYRAVMRNTVSLTLSDALSENVVLLTSRMREMVQQEADAMGLGVQVVALTMSGMHPPVAVASAYEGVISAQIKGVTAVVNAQAFRNEALPSAETSVIVARTAASSQGALDLSRAVGESFAFRTLLSQYRAAPAEYQFRRRLETLEQNLAGKKFTVLDARFTRDGGEVWIEP